MEGHDPARHRRPYSYCAVGGVAVKPADVLRKIFMVDLLKGLSVTFRYQDPKEIYTEQYPLQRPQVAERYRGAPRLNVNPDNNETMCIACYTREGAIWNREMLEKGPQPTQYRK